MKRFQRIDRGSLRRGAVLGLVAASAAGTIAVVAFFVPASEGASVAAPTKGTVPVSATAGGTIDWSQVPDYVSVTSNGTVVGYVKKTDLVPSAPGQAVPGQTPSSASQPPADGARPQAPVVTVYGSDLVTVVGHEYPGQGFVPEGVDPATVPPDSVATSATAPSP